MGGISTDSLPLPSTSDAARDAATPGFLAHLERAYGSLEGLGDVLEMVLDRKPA